MCIRDRVKTAAIVVNNSSDHSNGVTEAFLKEAQALGIEVGGSN